LNVVVNGLHIMPDQPCGHLNAHRTLTGHGANEVPAS
jgi:hypothetical protein